MKIKTSELQGAALDWAVEAAQEVQFGEDRVVIIRRQEATTPAWIEVENYHGSAPLYHRSSASTDWAQGGPIIDREKIWLRGPHDAEKPDGTAVMHIQTWYAHINHKHVQNADTPLIAAMRCYVASKLGDTVEIPDSLATGAQPA